MCLQIIYVFNAYMHKEDSAVDNLQWLICHKTKQDQTKLISLFIHLSQSISICLSICLSLSVYLSLLSVSVACLLKKQGTHCLLFINVSYLSICLSVSITICLSVYLSIYCPRGVMVKALDCGIVVRQFVLQSRCYVHFRANTVGKGMSPLILPAMG